MRIYEQASPPKRAIGGKRAYRYNGLTDGKSNLRRSFRSTINLVVLALLSPVQGVEGLFVLVPIHCHGVGVQTHAVLILNIMIGFIPDYSILLNIQDLNST